MKIDWNMIIILVFITFNIGEICRTLKHIAEVKITKNLMNNYSIEDLLEVSEKINEKK